MPSVRAQVSLSFDVDWATDEVLEDTIALLDAANVKATFFATHKTAVLERLDRGRYEIGVHPNFNPLLEGKAKPGTTFRDVLQESRDMYDDVVGMRSHGVVSSGTILYHAQEIGFTYESNMYVPAPVPAFRDYESLIRIAMYWSDYRELLVRTPYRADALILPSECPAILAFHPVHVFINSETPNRYVETKNMTATEKVKHRHQGEPKGIRDFLTEFLARIQRENIETLTMRDIAEQHQRTHGDTIATHPHNDAR